MIAKQTAFALTGLTVKELEGAIAAVRTEGATDGAAIHFFPNGDSYTLKAEWETEVADPAAPAADTREQPTSYATGGVVDLGGASVLIHGGEVVAPVVQPDGLINETPAH